MDQRIAAIISEFNPLHLGHKYLLDFAKKNLRADRLIIIMSGCFTQRGIPACLDKYDRAKTAIECGADLCVELPVVAATSSAELFGKTGVSLALSLGATDIVFGAEDADARLFSDIASLLLDEPEAFKEELFASQKNGLSYPLSMKKALGKTIEDSSLLDSPNNMLGLMYVKAMRNKAISFHAVRRTGKGHAYKLIDHSGFSSSLSIRNALKENNIASALSQMPFESGSILEEKYNKRELVFEDDISDLLHLKLFENEDFTLFSDVTEDLSNRILSLRDEFLSFSGFAALLKSKNVTLSRVTRALIHILLDIKNEDVKALEKTGFSPYVHILAMKKGAAELLRNVKVPLFASISEKKGLSPEAEILQKKDRLAYDIYRILLTKKTGRTFENESSRKFELIE